MRRKRSRQGFTVIELMVGLTTGLLAITALYTLGSASTRNFYRQHELATTQTRVRNAFRQLQAGIARAGFLATPNATKENNCETPPQLPDLSGSFLPLASVHYYTDVDSSVVDPLNVNGVIGDRIRVLGNYETTDRFLLNGYDSASGNIAFDTSDPTWERVFETAQENGDNWSELERVFHSSAWLHFESTSGRHFFRRFSTLSKTGTPTSGYTAAALEGLTLPFGSTCIPGVGEGMKVSPLTWYEYAVVDPFATDTSLRSGHSAGYKYKYLDATTGSAVDVDASAMFEQPNAVLVRRRLWVNPTDNSVETEFVEFLVEFVANFEVSFVIDTNSGTGGLPALSTVSGTTAQTAVNLNPERVRSVIIDLSIRTPKEDPTFPYVTRESGDPLTRFELDEDQTGSARVRNLRMEIPVPNIARRNL